MSMLPPESPPRSALTRFGTSVVGPQFEWEHPNDEGDGTEVMVCRAVASVNFEDTLRYTTGRHAAAVQTAVAAREMRAALEETDVTSPDYVEQFERVVQERLEHESKSWAATIDIILILVKESDRDQLRPHLLDGDPVKVGELRDWLEQNVLGTAAAEAAQVNHVDPTSRPQPPNSASSPDSGEDSGSKESTSTD